MVESCTHPSRGEPSPEPTQASVRALLRPPELLAELWWLGPEQELGLPIPQDARGVIDPAADRHVAVEAHNDPIGLRFTMCSILERAERPIALSVLLDEDASEEVADTAWRIERAVAGVRVFDAVQMQADARVFAEGQELSRSHLKTDSSAVTRPAVAYLLPGLPPEGSGGSHSLVQEARGLKELGCDARICVPAQALDIATSLYGNDDRLFVEYRAVGVIADAIGDANVAVATEHPSLPLLQRLKDDRPELICAYYVQDYEPLFARTGSARSDRALLSYRAIPGQVLFAKTHWLCNVLTARHGTPVAKVRPSLDRDLFHADGRSAGNGVVRIAAMVRPRTPRRRPLATLRALAAIRERLGEAAVTTTTFGCDAAAYERLVNEMADANSADCHAGNEHLGLLAREQVAELMRRCDVFIDASAYQAFGRSGLEAMACGAVPILPALGGVHEYAVHEHNAVVIEDDSPAGIAEAVVSLAGEPARLQGLCQMGLRSARRFSIELAARSQLELFTDSIHKARRVD